MAFLSQSTVTTGLVSQGTNGARPTVFELDGEIYLYNGGKANAWKWNFSTETWEANTTITNFDVPHGTYDGVGSFWFNSELYLLVVPGTNVLGYKWNSLSQQWQQNNFIANGLTAVSEKSAPTIFFIGDDLFLIMGDYNGTFKGWKWNPVAETWEANTTIETGLSDSGGAGTPASFYYGPDLYLVANKNFAWKWNIETTQWDLETSLFTGLTTVNYYLTYYELNSVRLIIGGTSSGSFIGYKYTPAAKISNITVASHGNCQAKFNVLLTSALDPGETLVAYLRENSTIYSTDVQYLVELTQESSMLYSYNSNLNEGSPFAFQVIDSWDATTLQTLQKNGSFWMLPEIIPTVININDPNNYKIFNDPRHAYNHGLIHVAGSVFGSARNYPTAGASDIFKIQANDYSNYIQKSIYQNKTNSLSPIKEYDQIISAGGFLWIHSETFLIRIDPTDLDYIVFSGVNATNWREPLCTDGSHLFITAGTEVVKLDLDKLLGSFPSYSYDGSSPVPLPANTILGTCPIIQHHPTVIVYVHSSITDGNHLFINCSSTNINNGYDNDLEIQVCHLQKIRISDMVSVGDVLIPLSTDDVTQNSEYLFLAPELGGIVNVNTLGKDWGLYAVNKSNLDIKYLKGLYPGQINSTATNAAFGVFLFGNQITVQNITNKHTIVIDISDIENWGENKPLGYATKTIFLYQLNGVALTVPCNELVLDSNGWVHTNTWESDTMIFKFNSLLLGVDINYNVLTLSYNNNLALLELINENFGCSIRCVQDAPGEIDGVMGEASDIDGNVYTTIIINEKRWFVENLKVTSYRDGTSIPYISDSTEWSTQIDGARVAYNNNLDNISCPTTTTTTTLL